MVRNTFKRSKNHKPYSIPNVHPLLPLHSLQNNTKGLNQCIISPSLIYHEANINSLSKPHNLITSLNLRRAAKQLIHIKKHYL